MSWRGNVPNVAQRDLEMKRILFQRTRSCSGQKKAGRFPIRVREGPAKNLFLKQQRDAQQEDTKVLAGLFQFRNKRTILNLAGFLALLLKQPLK